jgi:hypothetical protein
VARAAAGKHAFGNDNLLFDLKVDAKLFVSEGESGFGALESEA